MKKAKSVKHCIYCIYKSDPTKTKFEWVDDAESEQDGRKKIAAFVWVHFCMNDFEKDKFICLYLFKGKDNKSGVMILQANMTNKNFKPLK